MLQIPGQSMPGGFEVTRPDPLPGKETVTRGGGPLVNVAVTSRSASMATEQSAPEQAPCQPANVEPTAGTPVSCTLAFAAMLCVHCVLQSIGGLDERTAPNPLPAIRMVSVRTPGPPLTVPLSLGPHAAKDSAPRHAHPIARIAPPSPARPANFRGKGRSAVPGTQRLGPSLSAAEGTPSRRRAACVEVRLRTLRPVRTVFLQPGGAR